MLFAKLFVVLTGAAGVTAKVFLTNENFDDITTGVPFEVTWANQTGLIALLLKDGPADNQNLVDTIASGLTGNSFEWTPAENLEPGIYNLEIQDTNGDVNYSPQFMIEDGVALPITSSPMPVPTETEYIDTTASYGPSFYLPDVVLRSFFSTPYPCGVNLEASCTGFGGLDGGVVTVYYPATSSEGSYVPGIVTSTVTTKDADPTGSSEISYATSSGLSTSTVIGTGTYISVTQSSVMYSNATASNTVPSITQSPTTSIVTALAVPNATPLVALLGVGGLAFLL